MDKCISRTKYKSKVEITEHHQHQNCDEVVSILYFLLTNIEYRVNIPK
jgi:hypothetical protein